MRNKATPYFALALIAIAFASLSWSEKFVQDDAYITLSYARNLIDGHGLVFNVGEYVEGFTSLVWTLIAATLMAVGVRDVASALQVVGIASTTFALLPVYRISQRILAFADTSADTSGPVDKSSTRTANKSAIRNAWLGLIAPLFIASTTAVQYWSSSAMEAPFFWLVMILTLEAFIVAPQSYRWVAIGMLALLTRPEAMLLVGLLFVARIVLLRTTEPLARKRLIRQILLQGALLGGTLAALTAWRWFSYGALLPNTFAAKTGFLSDQLYTGLAYLYDHIMYVWMFAALIPVLAVLWFVRNREVLLIAVLALTWTLAVVYLGGDVLRHQRFLIPVQVLLATLLPAGWYLLFARRVQLVAAAVVIHTVFAFMSERDAISATSSIEQQLVMKMRRTGEWLKRSSVISNRQYVVATTIGALKYFSHQTIIDMLGLTDRTIATQPVVIPEVSNDPSVTWKERKYNADYVLARKPDFILFSTGVKPSAFAERALWARQMYVDYYVFYYKSPRSPNMPTMFRRKPIEVIERSPQHRQNLTSTELQALLLYPQAVSLVLAPSTQSEAERLFRRIAANGPANYGQPYQYLGDIEMARNNVASATTLYERAIAIDPCDIRSHNALFQIKRHERDSVSAAEHADWVQRFNPVLFTQLGIRIPEDAQYRW